MFNDKTVWWDVLCNLENGTTVGGCRSSSSPRRRTASSTSRNSDTSSGSGMSSSSSATKQLNNKNKKNKSDRNLVEHFSKSDSSLNHVDLQVTPINNEEAIERHRVVVAKCIDAIDAGT